MPVLEARSLYKSFPTPGGVKEVVSDVSLSISEGEILGFLGKNGAGKTTTIKMIASLITPTSGSVAIQGRDPHKSSKARLDMGAVLEGSRNVYWRFTVMENLEYFGALRGLSRKESRRRGAELIERFGLTEAQDRPIMGFSRGMQQKVAIMVALLHQPKLLLLDEPTIALDVEAAAQVKELVQNIAAEGQAILITSHQLDVVEEIAHRIAIIDQGKLIVEERTQKLLEDFAARAFHIRYEGQLSSEQNRRLAELEVEIEGQTLVFQGEPAKLYEVLDTVRPLLVVSIEENRETLTSIFLELIRAHQS